jgi:hypothetical protein
MCNDDSKDLRIHSSRVTEPCSENIGNSAYKKPKWKQIDVPTAQII